MLIVILTLILELHSFSVRGLIPCSYCINKVQHVMKNYEVLRCFRIIRAKGFFFWAHLYIIKVMCPYAEGFRVKQQWETIENMLNFQHTPCTEEMFHEILTNTLNVLQEPQKRITDSPESLNLQDLLPIGSGLISELHLIFWRTC